MVSERGKAIQKIGIVAEIKRVRTIVPLIGVAAIVGIMGLVALSSRAVMSSLRARKTFTGAEFARKASSLLENVVDVRADAVEDSGMIYKKGEELAYVEAARVGGKYVLVLHPRDVLDPTISGYVREVPDVMRAQIDKRPGDASPLLPIVIDSMRDQRGFYRNVALVAVLGIALAAVVVASRGRGVLNASRLPGIAHLRGRSEGMAELLNDADAQSKGAARIVHHALVFTPGFVIDRRRYVVPVDEIVEMAPRRYALLGNRLPKQRFVVRTRSGRTFSSNTLTMPPALLAQLKAVYPTVQFDLGT